MGIDRLAAHCAPVAAHFVANGELTLAAEQLNYRVPIIMADNNHAFVWRHKSYPTRRHRFPLCVTFIVAALPSTVHRRQD